MGLVRIGGIMRDEKIIKRELDYAGINQIAITDEYFRLKEELKDSTGYARGKNYSANHMANWAAEKVANYYLDQIEDIMDSMNERVESIQVEYNESLKGIREAVKKVADTQPVHYDHIADMINTVKDLTLVSKNYSWKGQGYKRFDRIREGL